MDSNVLTLVVKTFIIVLVFIYFLIGILIARQVFLMNKAMKTKIAGLLNFLSIVHIFLILVVLIVIVFV
jgi:hypothetical protein